MGFSSKSSSTDTGNFKKIQECLDYLNTAVIEIGIPENKNVEHEEKKKKTKKTKIMLADLLAIQTYGTMSEDTNDGKGIPPRPVLEPALEYNKDALADYMKDIIDVALEEDLSKVKTEVNKLGQQCANFCQEWFTESNRWAANTPETIKAKGSSNPLIDSHTLRKSITYAVKE